MSSKGPTTGREEPDANELLRQARECAVKLGERLDQDRLSMEAGAPADVSGMRALTDAAEATWRLAADLNAAIGEERMVNERPAPLTDPTPPPEIVARPWWWCRAKWYAAGAVLIAAGAWFMYDGYVKWPRENEEARASGREIMPHSDFDLRLQRAIAYTLPPLGIACIIWTWYTSRGKYRLADDVLHVPGHPPVPVDSIRAIDKRKWDRNGVAYIEYERPDGKAGRLKLDDYIYERKPTDAILERIEEQVIPMSTQRSPQSAAAEALEPREII